MVLRRETTAKEIRESFLALGKMNKFAAMFVPKLNTLSKQFETFPIEVLQSFADKETISLKDCDEAITELIEGRKRAIANFESGFVKQIETAKRHALKGIPGLLHKKALETMKMDTLSESVKISFFAQISNAYSISLNDVGEIRAKLTEAKN